MAVKKKSKYVIVRTYSAGVFAGRTGITKRAGGSTPQRSETLVLGQGCQSFSTSDGRNKETGKLQVPM